MSNVMSAKQKSLSKKITNKKLKSLMASTALAAAGLVLLSAGPASALPSGEVVVGGSVTYDRPDASTLNANQTSAQAYTLWDTFDTSAGETVNINLPGADALSVNKVQGTDIDGTQFDGILNSNGNVWILDQNGVFFGATATIDVGGLLASTGDLTVADVMDGDGSFTFNNLTQAEIVHRGTMTVAEGGLAAFVGPNVANRGIINARLGTVAFAAGNSVTVDFYGDGLYEIAVSGQLAEAGLRNTGTGTINAEGGTVLMAVDAAKAIVNNVINLDGVVDVTSATEVDGKIVLRGGSAGRVQLAGDIDAGSVDADGSTMRVKAGADIVSDDLTLKTDELALEGDITANEVAIRRKTAGQVTVGSEVATHLSLTQAELDKITAGTLTIGHDDAGESAVTDINIGAVDFTAFGTVGLNALAASSISFNDIVSFGNLIASADSIFVNAALSASGVNFSALDGGAGLIQINDSLNTAGGDANFTADSFAVSGIGSVNTLGGNVNLNADAAQIDGGVNAGSGTITVLRNSNGRISLGDANGGMHLAQSELDNLNAGALVVGGANTTSLNVDNADISHIDDVELNAQANERAVNFSGNNNFDDLTANAGSEINVTDGTTSANSIDFNSPTVNLNGDLNSANITGTGATVNVQSDSADIQDGIDVAANGATVNVAAGTYSEAVSIGKDNITVNGANSGVNPNTGVRGPESLVLPGLAAGFSITGTGVTVDGFTVGNGLAGADLSGSTDATVQNNIFSGGLWGAFGNGASGVSLLNNEIKNTTAQGVNFSFLTGTNNINDNVIDGNGISLSAIVITDSDDVTIDGNSIEEVLNTAVNISDSSDVTLNDNDIFGDNDHTGVDVNDGSNISVTNNRIDDFETGVDVNGTNTADVSGNTVTSAEYGVVAKSVGGLTVVGNPLSGNSVTGVDIDSSNGATVDNNTIDDFATGVKVVDSADVWVKNNTVNRSETGIDADNAEDIKISDNTVTDSSVTGIHVKNSDGTGYGGAGNDVDIWGNTVSSLASAGAGILVENSAFATVGTHPTNPFASGLAGGNKVSGGVQGIVINGSSNAYVENNTVQNVSGEGVDVNGSDNTSVLANVINNTGAAGVSINPSSNVLVSGNIIDNTGADAINVQGGTNNTVQNNIIGTNGGAGNIQGDGVELNNSDTSTASGNQIANATGNGVLVINDSDSATINNNNISNVGADGVRVVGGSDSSSVLSNQISSTGAYGVFVGANATAISQNEIVNTGNDGIEVHGSNGVSIFANKVGVGAGANNIGGEGIDVNDSASASITSNQVNETTSHGISLNPSSGSVLSNNLITFAGADGINTAGSTDLSVVVNRIFDSALNGINANGASRSNFAANTIARSGNDGINLVNGDIISATGNFITNSGDNGVHAHNITNLNISTNIIDTTTIGTDNNGIFVTNSNGAIINTNDVANAGWDAVKVGNSADVQIINNTINNPHRSGIAFFNAPRALVDNNTVNNTGTWGILGWNGSNDSIVTRNNINITGGTGIEISNSDRVRVGHVIDASQGNTITNAGWDGIALTNGADNALVGNNRISDTTGASGIAVLNSSFATLVRNLIQRSARLGVYAGNADNLVVSLNNIIASGIGAGDWSGVHIENTNNANVTQNTIRGASKDGITAGVSINFGVTGNTGLFQITSNTIGDTARDGIHVESTNGVQIQGNRVGTIGNIGDEGIDVNNSAAARIIVNTVTNAVSNGISLNPSNGSLIRGNNIFRVGGNGIDVNGSTDVIIDNNNVGTDAANNDFGANNVGGQGINVHNGSNNVTILRNDVTDTALNGIQYLNSTGGDIHTNNVSNTGQNGINLNGITGTTFVRLNNISDTGNNGINVEGSTAIEVLENTIDDTADNGIRVSGGQLNSLTRNKIGTLGGARNISKDGIHADGSNDLTLDGNIIRDTDDDGIDLRNLSGFSVVRNDIINTAHGNEGIYGFNIQSGTIGGSLAEQNTINARSDGIRLDDSSNVVISFNDVDTRSNEGIEIDGNSSNITIDRNNVHDTGDQGIEIDSGTSNITVTNNTITNTGDQGIEADGSKDLTISGNTITGTGDEGIDVDDNTGFLTIEENIISNTRDEGIQVTNSAQARVHKNTVTNAGTFGSDDGIYVHNTSNLRVTRNTVTETSEDGIHVSGSDGAVIRNNTVSDVEENGILVNPSDDVVIAHNTVHDADNDGIKVLNGDRAYIHNNHVGDVGDDGIDVTNNDDVRIHDNYIHDTGLDSSDGNGIEVDGNLFNNNADIRRNEIWRAGDDGIDVEDSAYADIRNNKIFDSGDDGIDVEDSYAADIADNKVRRSAGDGIEVRRSGFVDVLRNLVRRSGDDGIDVENSDNARVNGNTVEIADANGIEVQDSDNSDINGNTVSDAGLNGIYVNPSDNVDIKRNNIHDSGNNGIHVIGGNGIFIDDNHVGRSGNNGIFLMGAGNIWVTDNYVHNSYFDGIRIMHSNPTRNSRTGWGVHVIDNDVRRSGDDGIEVHYTTPALIKGNDVRRSGFAGGVASGRDNDGYGNDAIHVGGIYGTNDQRDGYSVRVVNNYTNKTVDDGIEVHYSGRTFIGWNDVNNAGYGPGGSYGGGDETGADGIYVNNVYAGLIPAGESQGGFYGYDVNIIGNEVDTTADDGIEVTHSGSTLIGWNDVYNAGYGATGGGNYGLGDYYGADAIHVRDVYGSDNYGNDGRITPNGIERYAVVITDNITEYSADDGIEVAYAGRTLIQNNDVYHAGVGVPYMPYDGLYSDGHGADGIHVREVYNGKDYGPEGIGPNGFYNYAVNIINNEVHKTGDDGVEVIDSGTTVISDNNISHVGTGYGRYYGGGDFLFGADGIHVRNVGGNGIIIKPVPLPNQTAGFSVDNSFREYSVVLDNNTIDQTADDGAQVLFSGDTRVANNTITNSGTPFGARILGGDGISILTFGRYGRYGEAYTHIEIVDNIVENSLDDGVEVMGTNLNVLVDSNTVDQSGDNGVHLLNLDGFFGCRGCDNDIGDGPQTTLAPIPVAVTGFNSEVTGNTISNSGEIGLFVDGRGHNDVIISDNVFTDNPVHARVESGLVDLTGGTNAFNFGDVALQFSGPFPGLELVDNTIGAQFFNGQSTFFVELQDGAFFDPGTPTILDATDSTFVTPFGTVTPSATGDFIGADVFAFLESRFFHFNDVDTLGLFFFGNILSPELDQEDIFNEFGIFDPFGAGLNFTLNGLPFVDPAFALANIAPAAGDDENSGATTAEELASLEPAAGGDDTDANCWADAVNAAQTGVSVNYSFGGSLGETLADAAGCAAGTF